jgi:predicted nucleic acid-binding protein
MQSMSQAWIVWNRVWADDRVKFLPEPDDLEQEFRLRSRLQSPSPKIWADAYLLAFAAVAGLQLVTFDRAIKAPGVSVLQL